LLPFTNRSLLNKEHYGPLRGPDKHLPEDRRQKVRESGKVSYAVPFGKNLNGNTKLHNPNKCSYDLPEQERETTHFSHIVGMPSNRQAGQYYDSKDQARGTKFETFIADTRQPQGVHKSQTGAYYNPNDHARGTMHEQYNQDVRLVQGVHNTQAGHYYDANDHARGTIHEQYNQDVRQAQPIYQSQVGQYYNPNDHARGTIHEQYNQDVRQAQPIYQSQAGQYYNPNDHARGTIHEQYNQDVRQAQPVYQSQLGHYYNPNDHARRTTKEQYVEVSKQASGPSMRQVGHYYNPNDRARTTTREQFVEVSKQASGPSMKQIGHYHNPNDHARTTIREQTHYSHQGIAGGVNVPTSQMAERNMEMHLGKEELLRTRAPVQGGPVMYNSYVNMTMKDPINIGPYRSQGPHVSNNSLRTPAMYEMTHSLPQTNNVDPRVLHQLQNNSLVNNVVFQNNQANTNPNSIYSVPANEDYNNIVQEGYQQGGDGMSSAI